MTEENNYLKQCFNQIPDDAYDIKVPYSGTIEKETVPLKRIPWNEYKEILERFEYTEEQIQKVFEVRETAEEITKEQFDFLVSSGVIKKKVKLKKIRSMFIVGDDIVFLSHYHKGWQIVGYFINE